MANFGGGQCVKSCEALEGRIRINAPIPPAGQIKSPASGLPYIEPNSTDPQTISYTSTTFGRIDASSPSNKPVPYTFRVTAPPKCCETRHAKCPPFYLQLDHIIAVLWYLFEAKVTGQPIKRDLGIGQLQWALYFIKGIKSPADGTYSPDVEVAIRAIEDGLLDCYAAMSGVVMRYPPPQGRPCMRCDLERSIPRGPCNICSALSLGVSVRPRKSGVKLPSNEFSTRPTVTQMNLTNLNQSKSAMKPVDQALTLEIDKLRGIAAKFNYPNSDTRLQDNELQASSVKTKPSCEELYSLLKNWREDQIHRVENELRRLKSLDTYIGNEMDMTEISAATSEWPSSVINAHPIANSTARPGRCP